MMGMRGKVKLRHISRLLMLLTTFLLLILSIVCLAPEFKLQALTMEQLAMQVLGPHLALQATTGTTAEALVTYKRREKLVEALPPQRQRPVTAPQMPEPIVNLKVAVVTAAEVAVVAVA
jgi:hypothetical protein